MRARRLLKTHDGYILLALEAGAWIEVRRDYIDEDGERPVARHTYAGVLVQDRNDTGHRIGGGTFSSLLHYRYLEANQTSASHIRYGLAPRGAEALAQWKDRGGGKVADYWATAAR